MAMQALAEKAAAPVHGFAYMFGRFQKSNPDAAGEDTSEGMRAAHMHPHRPHSQTP